jgi:hypothetical protein
MAKTKFQPPSICPVCGEEVPPRALACPECGADEESEWKEGAEYEHAGFSEEEFDYEAFVAEEFGGGKKKSGRQLVWWIAAIVVLAALLAARFFF